VNPMKKMMSQLGQFQEMQDRMQQELEKTEVQASAGGEMVTVTMNGKKEVTAVRIDPQVVTPDDVEMLEDLIVAALGECGRKVDELVASKLSGLTAGLKIPGLGL
jgi:nucleoid-associated protein EbfC